MLKWAPPTLINPVTVNVTNSTPYWLVTFNNNTDYIIQLPTGSALTHGIGITGGRNVVIIGGEINISNSYTNPEDRVGIKLRNQAGTVHIEGLKILNASDGINMEQKLGATVQLENLYVETPLPYEDVGGGGFHADIVQTWAGPSNLRIDYLTGKSSFQGLFFDPNDPYFEPHANPNIWEINHVNIDSNGAGSGYDYESLSRSISWTFIGSNLYGTNPTGHIVYTGFGPFPSVTTGSPPGGDFVPSSSVGLGYVSPGYQNGNATSISSSKSAFIWSNAPRVSTQRTFVSGQNPVSGSLTMYINTGKVTQPGQLSYIVHNASLGNQPSFIDGYISLYGQQAAYVTGGYPLNYGNALRLERSLSQYAYWPNNKAYQGLSKFTFNYWVRLREPAYNFNYRGLVTKSGVFEDRINSSAQIEFYTRLNGSWYNATVSGVVVQDKWMMLTTTYDGELLLRYVNGVLKSTTVIVNGPLDYTSNNFYAGYYEGSGSYHTMDVAQVTLRDYALTASEILALYNPNKCISIPAYISAPQVFTSVITQPLYINSPLAPNNPESVSGSLGAVIPWPNISASKNAFITAGSPQEVEWDTQITVQNSSEHKWDIIIRVNSWGEYAQQNILGYVDYPITRTAIEYIDVATKLMPYIRAVTQPCYLNSGLSTTSTQMCYVGTENFITNFKLAYLHGQFNNITGTKFSYITGAPSIEQSISAFVVGTTTYTHTTVLPAFLHATINWSQGTLGAFIKGGGDITGSQIAWVSAQQIALSRTQIYITGVTIYHKETDNDSESPDLNIYIPSSAVQPGSQPAFIFGHFSLTGGQNGYINAIAGGENTGPSAFIRSPFANLGFSQGFVYGNEPAGDSQPAFIQATLNIDTPKKDSYIAGVDSRVSFRRAYISVQQTTPPYSQEPSMQPAVIVGISSTTNSQTAFVAGNNTPPFNSGNPGVLGNSQSSFINSRFIISSQLGMWVGSGISLIDNQPSFIHVNVGTASSTKGAFIWGWGADIVRAYIMNVGNLSDTQFAYISAGNSVGTQLLYLQSTTLFVTDSQNCYVTA
jgi:hypothetical protein